MQENDRDNELSEATERFKQITTATGIPAPSPNSKVTEQSQRLPALDANIVIGEDSVTVTADDGITISLSPEEWEILRVEFGLDHTIDYKNGETPASGYIFRSCVDVFREAKRLETEKEQLLTELREKA